MEKLLDICRLSAGYVSGKTVTTVLRDVSLTLCRGRLVSLLGANGAGKSTLLRSVSGVQRPLAGDVRIAGKPVGSYGRAELSRLVAIVSTERTQAGGLTVEELVGLGRQPHTGFLGRLGDSDRRIVGDAMEAVGIGYKAHAFVAELSDGERQKAMIARALAQEAPIIILDEPTSFLDVASRIDTLQLLHRLAREEGKAVLLSSHDISQSLALSDELWLLTREGTIVAGGTEDLVLSGAMSGLFDERIVFDMQTGEFACGAAAGKEIALTGGHSELNYWIANALRRNGYRPVGEAELTVEAESASAIRLGDRTLHSVAEMIETLNGLTAGGGH